MLKALNFIKIASLITWTQQHFNILSVSLFFLFNCHPCDCTSVGVWWMQFSVLQAETQLLVTITPRSLLTSLANQATWHLPKIKNRRLTIRRRPGDVTIPERLRENLLLQMSQSVIRSNQDSYLRWMENKLAPLPQLTNKELGNLGRVQKKTDNRSAFLHWKSIASLVWKFSLNMSSGHVDFIFKKHTRSLEKVSQAFSVEPNQSNCNKTFPKQTLS